MTDLGTIGPTETEMNAFQATFDNMRNAIIAGSKLAQEFERLKVEVDGLRQDLARERQANAASDEALAMSRQSRDSLREQLTAAHEERNAKVSELETALHERHERTNALEGELGLERTRNSTLASLLNDARTERDNAQLRVLELEDELSSANAKLASVTEAMDKVQQALHPIQTSTQTQAVYPPESPDVPQHEGETDEAYYGRVGRYPSEREARAAAQPRAEGGQFTAEPVNIAAKSSYDDLPF